MLVNRQQFLSTKVLPQGLWTFGVSHGRWTKGGGSYAGNGNPVSNQTYFSRDISYAALGDEITDPLERELARAAFDVYGRSSSEIAGTAVNDVSVDQQSNTYVIGRGLSTRSSLFLAIPVVTMRTSIRSRFRPSASLDNLVQELRSDGQHAQAEEILENSRNALHNRLEETGYNPDYPTDLTTVANVFLTHRLQGRPSSNWELGADSSIVIPAGKSSGTNDFLYLRFNEEQYSARQSLTATYSPHGKLEVLGSTYYHLRFPFEKSRRIPLNSTSPLSSDVDRSARIRYGDTYGMSAQINFLPRDNTMVYLGQSQEFKNQDQVSGSLFESSRYDYLEQNTTQQLSLTYVGIAVNTIKSFLAQDFPAPVDLNLQYSFSTAGQNAMENRAIAMTLMVFYK